MEALLESCNRRRSYITKTYTRHHWRGKTKPRNGNEQEEETCLENHSASVSEKGDANNLSDSEGGLLSPFAPFGRIKLWDDDVPAPATPDIIARKHKGSEKRTCCRSLKFDTSDLKRRARDDSVFEDCQVEVETAGQPRALLVYRKRKKVRYEVEEKMDWKEGEKESFDRQIDLFMTRMRDIQGEREFSQWKGSVMDSIVGAYLAQNVNDVLSSSAFMSLAAMFPREAVGISSPVEAMQKGKCRRKQRYSKTRNSTIQRTKTKHDPLLLNVLKDFYSKYHTKKKTFETAETIDWDSVRRARAKDISKAIQIRGMSTNLSERIKGCLKQLVKNFGNTDMEWIRDVPPHKAKEYLMSIYGLGLKSVECIRLLTLRQKAFPIDTNAGRVAIRLGWVTLKQLREREQFDHLNEYHRKMNSVQKCLWPRLSHLEWSIQYELHCHMITFGKVFCTEKDPNCYECPMKAECSHFASVEASAQAELTGLAEMDIEDYGLVRYRTRFYTSKRASISVVRKRKRITSLRTEHQVYVLPNGHDLLSTELESRERDESCPYYLLAIWTPESLEKDESIPEEDAVYGTFLVPARTATGGTFPLNGTFFQANEVFADHKSSDVPFRVPRASVTNLLSTTLYCGTNMSSICKGMTCVEVQKCFKRGFVCLRGLDLKTGEPKPLPRRFHNRAWPRKARKTKKPQK